MVVKYLIIFFLSLGAVFPSFAAEKPVDSNAAIVIFGATGDLTSKKLFPALYSLASQDKIDKSSVIVGVGRRDISSDKFRKQMQAAVEEAQGVDKNFWNQFQKRIYYHQADFDQDEGYGRLKKLLDDLGASNRLYYLSSQPSHFPVIVEKLKTNGLVYDPGNGEKWSRVAIEKPFGHDLNSALALQEQISAHLGENQIYRIDHYLGKEGMQNLLDFRFKEGAFEPLWNRRFIDHIQITLSEEIGIETRAQFWEETGLVRDLFQNHLMQILTLAAMESPSSLNPDSIHAEKLKLLESIRPFSLDQMEQLTVVGQYGTGAVKGSQVPSYRQEKGIPSESSVETFAAAKLFIDNERWKGVPFYLRAGKRLPVKTTEIAIVFKGVESEKGHTLFIRIQPEPAVFLQKIPKKSDEARSLIRLDAPSKSSTEAYEKIFVASLQGDKSLFVQADEQISSWRLWTPVIDYWKSHPSNSFPNYSAGTWGPKAAEGLVSWEVLGKP